MRPLDLQVNGYAGVDFNAAELSAEQLHHACAALREDGVGGILATVITDSIEAPEPVKNCANIRIVPTAPMLTQAILNIWNGTSVSSLFDTATLEPIYEPLYPGLAFG